MACNDHHACDCTMSRIGFLQLEILLLRWGLASVLESDVVVSSPNAKHSEVIKKAKEILASSAENEIDLSGVMQ